jgi:hypothetical protein
MEENGNNLPRCIYKIPSIFTILSLRILFLGTTAIFAGAVSGDWEATFCLFSLPFPLLYIFLILPFLFQYENDEIKDC